MSSSALLNGGFLVSSSHCQPDVFKTNATPKQIWDILRSWVALHKVKPAKEDHPSHFVLAHEYVESDFKLHALAKPESSKENLVRFQINPTKNWGPKAKAGKRSIDFEAINKSKKRKGLNAEEVKVVESAEVEVMDK